MIATEDLSLEKFIVWLEKKKEKPTTSIEFNYLTNEQEAYLKASDKYVLLYNCPSVGLKTAFIVRDIIYKVYSSEIDMFFRSLDDATELSKKLKENSDDLYLINKVKVI